MQEAPALYPASLEIDYSERQSRWKTLLRLFLAIPVLIFASILSNASSPIAIATWIAIILRGRIPHWLFDLQIRLLDWQARAYGYFALLTDTYPAFEGDYPIRFNVEYPERVTRWKVIIWKIVTAIPHFVVLLFLDIGAFFAVIIGWFAVLFTGRFPKGLHAYVVGVGRWNLRVYAYVLSLRDEYPPFSLSGVAGVAGKDTYVVGVVIGWLLAAAIVAGAVVVAVVMPGAQRMQVSYADVIGGKGGGTFSNDRLDITLMGGIDPANQSFPYLMPADGKRFVAFKLEINNKRGFGLRVHNEDFRLKDADGKWHDPTLTIVGGLPAAQTIGKHDSASVIVIFEVNEQGQPKELRYWGRGAQLRPVIWEFQ